VLTWNDPKNNYCYCQEIDKIMGDIYFNLVNSEAFGYGAPLIDGGH